MVRQHQPRSRRARSEDHDHEPGERQRRADVRGADEQGLNRFQWTLTGDPQPPTPEQIQNIEAQMKTAPEQFRQVLQQQLDQMRELMKTGGPTPCVATDAGRGGRGFGGGGGGGGRGGGGGMAAGAYRVTLTIDGKDVGSQTFSLIEDVWMLWYRRCRGGGAKHEGARARILTMTGRRHLRSFRPDAIGGSIARPR